MKNLPEDIMREILLRLPVKSLLRFRCVSQDWRCLISSSYFITLHQNRSTEKNPSLMLTDGRNFYRVEDNSCHKLDMPSLICTKFSNGRSKIKVVGSCNGLLCFSLLRFSRIHYTDPIYLFNPATQRRLKELPHVPYEKITQSSPSKIQVGFGYDPMNKDYKVVMLIYSYITFWVCDVWVYSLNSDNWRKLGDHNPFPDDIDFSYDSGMPVVNASIHWMVSSINWLWSCIYSFDLVHEVFRKLPLPPGERRRYHRDIFVMMEGDLSLFSTFGSFDCEIWVMKEYGVKESWTKHGIVLNWYAQLYTPVQFWKDEILFQYFGKELVLYNTKSKTERKFGILGLPIKFKAFIHNDSLVMLKDRKKK